MRTRLRSALEEQGHRVLEAGSAVELFRILDANRPDTLLLDVHLGLDDGLAIGAGLRQERKYNALKIVFMSGPPSKDEVVELSLWNVPILVKPFDFEALFEAIA